LRIAIIVAPFIAVPPADYGGTELFVAHLAEGLQKSNIDVVVYANGESTVQGERRWLSEKSQWPIKHTEYAWLKELDHTAWAVADALKQCDLIHVQSTQALALSRFANRLSSAAIAQRALAARSHLECLCATLGKGQADGGFRRAMDHGSSGSE
jgi:hypothetical protein